MWSPSKNIDENSWLCDCCGNINFFHNFSLIDIICSQCKNKSEDNNDEALLELSMLESPQHFRYECKSNEVLIIFNLMTEINFYNKL